MNNHIILGTMLLLSLFSLSATAEQYAASACDGGAIIEQLNERLSGLKSYKLNTEVEFQGASGKSEIVGKRPDRLRIDMSIDTPSGSRRSITVYDGTHQWLQKGEGSRAQVLKINLRRTTSEERPFDTGYYMMGSGLLNGEGLVSTIENLTSIYDLQAECGETGISLKGPLLPGEFENFADQRNSPQSGTRNIERFKREFSYLELSLTPQDLLMKGYSIGPSSDNEMISVTFSDVELNPELREGVFDYTPPEGAKPRDVTSMILNRRETN